jgi:hypothetical protein
MIVGLHAGEDEVGLIVRSSVALGDTTGTMIELVVGIKVGIFIRFQVGLIVGFNVENDVIFFVDFNVGGCKVASSSVKMIVRITMSTIIRSNFIIICILCIIS